MASSTLRQALKEFALKKMQDLEKEKTNSSKTSVILQPTTSQSDSPSTDKAENLEKAVDSETGGPCTDKTENLEKAVGSETGDSSKEDKTERENTDLLVGNRFESSKKDKKHKLKKKKKKKKHKNGSKEKRKHKSKSKEKEKISDSPPKAIKRRRSESPPGKGQSLLEAGNNNESRKKSARYSRSRSKDNPKKSASEEKNNSKRSDSRDRHKKSCFPERHQTSHSQDSHKRSRSRERRRRSRSKDSHKRSRSKERRERSRSKDSHKRSRSKERHRRSHSKDSHKRSQSKERHRHSRSKDSHKRSHSKDNHKPSCSREKRRRSHSKDNKRSHSREKPKRSRSRDRNRRSRSRERNRRSRSRDRNRRSRSRERNRRSRSRDRNRRSRSRDRNRRSRSRDKRKSPDSGRERRRQQRPQSRERDRSRSSVLELDKEKLLEIAKANVYAKQQAGLIPVLFKPPPIIPPVKVQPVKEEPIKIEGKTIAQLVSECKTIQRKQEEAGSDDEEEPVNRPHQSDDEESNTAPFVHHPFKLNPSKPIVMHIQNPMAKPMPLIIAPKEDPETLLKQFPVSSGSQHRKKEIEIRTKDPYGAWKLVEKTTEKTTTVTAIATLAGTVPLAVKDEVAEEDRVFPEPPQQNVDISTVVAEKLQAAKNLAQNPTDLEAMKTMYDANNKIQNWASSKQKPGQFTGSTDVCILRPEELANSNPRAQAWAKKDMFHTMTPVTGGMGMYLLQKMGWRHGEGLGKFRDGSVEPLMLDVKTDRKGLLAAGEFQKKKGAAMSVAMAATNKDLSGKHPVSVLMELCNKRRWNPPEFEVIHESGPDHKKNFVFKVRINGEEFQPAMASANKKQAKAHAASIALQKMGLIPAGPLPQT